MARAKGPEAQQQHETHKRNPNSERINDSSRRELKRDARHQSQRSDVHSIPKSLPCKCSGDSHPLRGKIANCQADNAEKRPPKAVSQLPFATA